MLQFPDPRIEAEVSCIDTWVLYHQATCQMFILWQLHPHAVTHINLYSLQMFMDVCLQAGLL